MALVRGIEIYSGTTAPLLTGSALPIVIVGTAQGAIAAVNTITKVTSTADAIAKFGTHTAGDTIPRSLEVLLRYGCNNIYVIRTTYSATPATNETNLIGADTAGARTGLYLVKDIPSKFNVYPAFVLVPGFNNDAVAVALDSVVNAVRGYGILDATDGDTVAAVLTARDTATGIGKKSERLIIAYPSMKRVSAPTIFEPLSVHIAGSVAKDGSYGKSTSSLTLLGVSEPSITLSMSLTDENSDTAKLNAKGVVTIIVDGNNYKTWGDRNALYPSAMSDRSYITVVRLEDAIMQRAIERARKFIDQPATVTTALLAQASFNAMFYEMTAQGEINSGKATWSEAESDLSTGKLKYALEAESILPVELIQLAVTIGV